MDVKNQSHEKSLLNKFKVVELEKRYEFGWQAKQVDAKTPYGDVKVWER